MSCSDYCKLQRLAAVLLIGLYKKNYPTLSSPLRMTVMIGVSTIFVMAFRNITNVHKQCDVYNDVQ